MAGVKNNYFYKKKWLLHYNRVARGWESKLSRKNEIIKMSDQIYFVFSVEYFVQSNFEITPGCLNCFIINWHNKFYDIVC
jgi:hypothetical protein